MKCQRVPKGWVCGYGQNHLGPCPAIPKWWNVRGWWWYNAIEAVDAVRWGAASLVLASMLFSLGYLLATIVGRA